MLAPLAPYMTAIKIGAVVLVIGALAWQRGKINDQRDTIEAYKIERVGWQAAQKTNLDTIATLNGKIDKMVTERALEREASNKAVALLAQQDAATAAKLTATEKELANVYANRPSARAWGVVGVDASVADRLPGNSRPR